MSPDEPTDAKRKGDKPGWVISPASVTRWFEYKIAKF